MPPQISALTNGGIGLLQEFWNNFTHNLFKPLLLFFYFGFLIPILKVRFEFPYVIYQGLTMYLLLAIGWHGGEELAQVSASSVGAIVGFMVLGFVLNCLIGGLAYLASAASNPSEKSTARPSPATTGRTRPEPSPPASPSWPRLTSLSTPTCR